MLVRSLVLALVLGACAAQAPVRAQEARQSVRAEKTRAPGGCGPAGAAGAVTPGVATTAGDSGELIAILPKNDAGVIPVDEFELAPGARIVESRWSPLLCATVARIVGPADLPPAQWIRRLPEGGSVVPNTLYETADAEVRPLPEPDPDASDPYRPLQYGLDWIGADEARTLTAGRGVRVAVLDSAPEVGHADLGSVRMVEASASSAPATHGTLVTGVIAAVEGNGLGIAGVSPQADVVAIPVCQPSDRVTGGDACPLYGLLRGLDTAWDEQADLLNLSIVGDANPALERATARLDELGIVMVAAAGNDGTDEARYPAAYASVIGVAAIDRDGVPFARNNRGASAEIHAPGVEIVSTVPGDGFAFSDGTSLATAHVTGLLALLTASTGDARSARGALFESGQLAAKARPEAPVVPRVCEALGRLGRPCPGR